jgi:hypothetical protein
MTRCNPLLESVATTRTKTLTVHPDLDFHSEGPIEGGGLGLRLRLGTGKGSLPREFTKS